MFELDREKVRISTIFFVFFDLFLFDQKFFFSAGHYLKFKVGVSSIKLDRSSAKLVRFMK